MAVSFLFCFSEYSKRLADWSKKQPAILQAVQVPNVGIHVLRRTKFHCRVKNNYEIKGRIITIIYQNNNKHEIFFMNIDLYIRFL